MAYIAPISRTTGDLVTAAIWNADVGANVIAINAGAIAIASQAVGDIVTAASSSQLARLAAVAVGSILVSAGTGTSPAYSSTPTFQGTNITGTAVSFTSSNVTTNANLTGMVVSTGNAAVLGSFTSANLASALTDETGTGYNVFGSAPTITNVVLAGTLSAGATVGVSSQLLSSTGTGIAWVAAGSPAATSIYLANNFGGL